MTTRNRHIISKSLIGAGLSLTLIIYLVLSLDWNLVVRHIQKLQFLPLVPIIIVTVAQYIVRAFRWKLIIDRPGVSVSFLFDGLMLGNLASYILPLRAGEVVRSALVSSRTSIPLAHCLASVVIERLFDLLMVLITFGVISSFIDTSEPWLYGGALALTSAGALLLTTLLLAAFFPGPLWCVFQWCLSPLKTRAEKLHSLASRLFSQLLKSAELFKRPSLLFVIFGLSVVVWILVYAFFYLFLLSSPEFPRSLLLAIAVCIVISLAVAAPSAPGFIGVYQTGCVAGFAVLGFPKEMGMAFALVTHAFQYVFVILVGLYSLNRQSLSWNSLIALRETK